MKFSDLLSGLVSNLELGLDLIVRAIRLWPRVRGLLQHDAQDASYENLFLETVLDIYDAGGAKAVLERRQGVRFRTAENDVVRDLVWGEGNPLARYSVRGARRLSVRAEGSRRVLLLGLDQRPAKGERRLVTSRRLLRDAFTRDTEYFEMLVERPTQRLSMKVLFPHARPPREAYFVTSPPGRPTAKVPVRYTVDRRPVLSRAVERPAAFTQYSLRWSW